MISNFVDTIKNAYSSWNDKYSAFNPALFFISGFFYDVITIDRIDSTFSIVQQIIFLIVTLVLLITSYLYEFNLFLPSGIFKKIWAHKDDATHFMIGSLLSAFTLFYFKSASSIWSFAFIIVLFIMLILNEGKRSKKLQVRMKWAMFYLCLMSFLLYVSPILIGSIGWLSFTTTIVLCGLCVYLIYFLFDKLGIIRALIFQEIITPAIVVSTIFSALYFLNWIPPVPISAQHLGIYHKVEKQNGNYILHYEKPWWRVWQNSDQQFSAYEGDQLFGFARIFSPIGFDDKVNFHWLYKTKNGKWVTAQKIPVSIKGGRGLGFRAFTYKNNYSEGDWLLKIETLSGKEIGETSFSVKKHAGTRSKKFKTRLF